MDARFWKRLVTMAEQETRDVLEHLPPELRAPAASVPVLFEPWVSEDLVETGLDPDILGLFSGDPYNTEGGTESLPPQIFLFLESLWEIADADEQTYRAEVRTTFLHELGHYLGLDEGDLEARGLE